MATATVDEDTGAKQNGKARTAAKRRPATLDDLKKKKKARTDEVVIPLGNDEIVVSIKAIGTTAYDELVAEHPPTPKQRSASPNASFNNDTFPCALIAACATTPRLSYEDVVELKDSDDWAGGEFQDLFMACVKVNQAGFDVSFNGAG